MGGGGLVILKHKSWHVYNEKNRERVRKDEEKAKLEEDEKKLRAQRADQEFRLGVLRGKSNSSSKASKVDSREQSTSSKEFVSAGTQGVHLNLFADLATKKDGSNEEHEHEKLKEKEKWEKQFTMHLAPAPGAADAPPTPWYAKEASLTDKVGLKSSKSVSIHDPASKFITSEHRTDASIKTSSSSSSSSTKKSKKDKKDKKRSHSHSQKSESKKSIEELRAERLEREKRERRKVEEMMQPVVTKESERQRGYNSAFNPEFTRNRNK